MLDHIVVLFFIFGGTPYCFPQWLHQFTAPPTVHSFLFSKSSPAFGISHVFDDSHSDRYEIMVLICTSLMVSDVELGEVLQMPPYHDPDNRQGNCKVAEPESYLQPIYWVTMILKNNLKVKQEESRAE